MRWKKEYQGLEVSQLRRLKQLEAENARLKKLVAEQALANEVLKEALDSCGLLSDDFLQTLHLSTQLG